MQAKVRRHIFHLKGKEYFVVSKYVLLLDGRFSFSTKSQQLGDADVGSPLGTTEFCKSPFEKLVRFGFFFFNNMMVFGIFKIIVSLKVIRCFILNSTGDLEIMDADCSNSSIHGRRQN